MFYWFNSDTDWETCSTATAETHAIGVSAFITARRGNFRWNTCTAAARGQGQKSNARWSIARATLTKVVLASTYLSNEEPGGLPCHPSLLKTGKPDTIRHGQHQQIKPKGCSLYIPPPPTLCINNTLQTAKGGGEKPLRCQQATVPHCYQAFPSKPLLKFPSNSPAHGPLSRWALSLMACQQQLAPCLLKTKMKD